jgi:hypothetical protein
MAGFGFSFQPSLAPRRAASRLPARGRRGTMPADDGLNGLIAQLMRAFGQSGLGGGAPPSAFQAGLAPGLTKRDPVPRNWGATTSPVWKPMTGTRDATTYTANAQRPGVWSQGQTGGAMARDEHGDWYNQLARPLPAYRPPQDGITVGKLSPSSATTSRSQPSPNAGMVGGNMSPGGYQHSFDDASAARRDVPLF